MAGKALGFGCERTAGCPCCFVVPPFMLRALARGPRPALADAARRTILVSQNAVGVRALLTERDVLPPRRRSGLRRQVFDCEGYEELPGEIRRREGDGPVEDAAVNRAFDGAGLTWDFFKQVLGRDSIDNNGKTLVASVHYGTDFLNALWDGTQMVYGNGDSVVFHCFTSAVDVIAHELVHGLTQFTAKLHYHGQPGALNESISDVFGVLVKQWSRRDQSGSPGWLIGDDLLLPAVQARALRDMERPGTAFRDNPYLGDDPQPGDMSHYDHTEDDNAGVHINSGIPNRAFVLAAQGIGGNPWDVPGRIWYSALTGEGIEDSEALGPTSDFRACAIATISAARRLFRDKSTVAEAVADAWVQTMVLETADVRQLGVGA